MLNKTALKILIGCVWGNDGRGVWVGGGLVAHQSLSTIKKGISCSNRVSSFLSFLENSIQKTFYTKK